MGEIYIKYEYWIAAFQLFFAMLGMGATLTLADFKAIIQSPKSVSIGIVIQLVLIPLIAYAFIRVFGLTGGVAIGIALIAAIPGGTLSNIFTYFAKGSVPLSISITSITTLACLITTPLILSLLITQYLPSNFTMPTMQIIRDIALNLLLPMIIGMGVLHYFFKQAPMISKWSIRLSLLGIVAIVVGSVSAGRLNLEILGMNNVYIICAFILFISSTIFVVTKLQGLSVTDSTAIEMEIIVRNINLAVLITASMFPVAKTAQSDVGNLVLLTVLLYGALQLVFAGIIIVSRRYTKF